MDRRVGAPWARKYVKYANSFKAESESGAELLYLAGVLVILAWFVVWFVTH